MSRATVYSRSAGKSFLGLLHQLPDALDGGKGIRTRQLVDGHDPGRLAVDAAFDVVSLRPQLDPGHVLQPDDRSVRVGPDNDLAELFLRQQAALGADGIGEFLSRRHGFAADLSGRIDRVLLLNGADDFGNSDAELCQRVGLDPDADRILSRAEDRDHGDAGHAQELVVKVDVGIVRHERSIVGPLRGVQGKDHQRGSPGFLDRHAIIAHVKGKLGLGLVLPHLGEDQVRVRVGLDIEVDEDPHRAVTGVDGIHVVHVVHAADLLLDGGGDGLLDRFCIGAGIGGGELNLRGNDIRELGNGQSRHRDEAQDDKDDGDDHRHDGSVDEEL